MARLFVVLFLFLVGCTPLVAEVFHVAGGGQVPVTGAGGAEPTSDIVNVPDRLTLIPKGKKLLEPQLKTLDGTVLEGVPFTFVSSDPSVVAVINGELVALKPGTAQITITGGGVSEVITVVVADVALSETEPDIAAVIQDVTLTALDATFELAVLTANSEGKVEWVSLHPTIATVDAKGVVTGLKEGTAQIQAILKENGVELKRVTIEVTIHQAISVIRIEPSPVVLDGQGDSLQLTVRAYDANNHLIGRELDFDWESGNVSRVSVDSDGAVTALPGSLRTTTRVTVTADGKSSSVNVTVGAGASVAIDQGPLTLTSLGGQATFTATVSNSTGTVLWSLSNGHATGAPASGPATTITAQSNGVVTLTATLMEGVEAVATATVAVTVQQTVASIDLSPVNSTLAGPGEAQQLAATAFDGNLNAVAGATFTWSSSHALLPVDANGRVTAQAGSFNASTTVRASIGAIQSNAATVAVGSAPTVAVNCAGTFPVASLGGTRTCTATLTNAVGTVTWTIENQTIANHDVGLGAHTTVATKADNSNNTTLTAVHDGAITLRATFLGIFDEITLDVEQAVATIDVVPTLITLTRQYDGGQSEAVNLASGGMGLYTATARDANNNVIERTLLFSWTEATGDVTAETDGANSRIGKAKAAAAVAVNLTRTLVATAEGVTSTDDGDDSGNVLLNYSAGDVPVVVVIP